MLEILDGTLAAEAALQVDTHLAECPRCRRWVSELSRGAAGDFDALDAPADDGGDEAEPQVLLDRGACIGRYVVQSRVGAGAMGVVYAAHDPELDRRVAIKLINFEDSDGSDLHERKVRLQREAQAMARLRHPCVVTVHDVGEFDGTIFIAMEFIDGMTLREWLATPRSEAAILEALARAGQGLQAAHASGLVHRDFKLDNVLIDREGRVCVTDFGLACPLRGDEAPRSLPEDLGRSPLLLELTRTGMFVGTPLYMAPELLIGEPADALSDQFSFCVALYEALYRERPFASTDLDTHTKEKQAGRIRPPPRGRRVPRFIRQAVLRGLAPRPHDRHPSMAALLQILGRTPLITPRRALVALFIVAAVVALGLFIERRAPGRLCRGADARFTGIWDTARRAAVQGALVKAGGSFGDASFARIASLFDGYRTDWLGLHREACEATRVLGRQSDEVLSLRMDCLERRLEELAALSALFTQADARLLPGAVTAAHGLPPLAVCSDRTSLTAAVRPPAERSVRDAVKAVRAELAAGWALDQVGSYIEGLAVAERAEAAARQLPYRPLVAESLYLRGVLALHAGQAPSAERVLLEAVSIAEASRHDELTARAWLEILAAQRVLRPRESQLEETLATAAVDRIGGSAASLVYAQLLERIGALRVAQGKYEEAAERYRRALALNEQGHGVEHPRVAAILDELGQIYTVLKERERAAGCFDRALSIYIKTLGPEHPQVGKTREHLTRLR